MTPRTTLGSPLAGFLLFSLSFALFPASLQADSPTAVDDQTAKGDRPFARFLASDIDQVQIISGALDVRLPLISRPGRGLTYERIWHYTNKIWMVQEIPTGLPPPNDLIRTWVPTNEGAFNGQGTGQVTYTAQEVVCNEQNYGLYSNFVFTDRFGTNHSFDAQKSSPGPNLCYPDKLLGVSRDTTGMTLDITNLLTTAVLVVREKDGTQETNSSSFWRKDSNGNFITSTQDTLGRTYTTQSVAGCPTSFCEDWSYRDSNGVEQKIRLEFTNIAYSTNFQAVKNGRLINESEGTISLVTKIILANGLAYQFTYDGGGGTDPGHYAELLRIDLPT
ncbi:MAG: hypothetical protein L0338_39555, partial [Acidobacteria bacterium]|nr:hypothetical protein [Acidobacteriota bacterium]